MEKVIIAVLIIWGLREHDRRVKLESFARLAAPCIGDNGRAWADWSMGIDPQNANFPANTQDLTAGRVF